MSFAGELLKLAEELLIQGLHPSEVVAGYKTASDFTLALLPSLVCHSVTNPRDEPQLKTAVKSVLMAKQLGYEDVLSSLVAEAALVVMTKDGPASMKAESIRCAKHTRTRNNPNSTSLLGCHPSVLYMPTFRHYVASGVVSSLSPFSSPRFVSSVAPPVLLSFCGTAS